MSTATTYTIGQTVHHARFGAGTIIAMDERNMTIQYADAVRSTMKAFASFVDAAAAPAIPEAIDTTAADATAGKKQRRLQRQGAERTRIALLTPAHRLMDMLAGLGSIITGDRASNAWQTIDEQLLACEERADAAGDRFACEVITTVRRTMRCSTKQAAIIAKYAA